MGNASSASGDIVNIPHTVPVDLEHLTDDAGRETCIYRSASHPSAIINNLLDGSLNTGYDIFKAGLATSGDKPYLGTRKRGEDGLLPNEYTYITYQEAYAMAQALGSALLGLDLVKLHTYDDEYPQAQSMRILGICSRNRPEWFITDIACFAYSIVSCPLYEALGDESLEFMLTQTKCSMVAGSEPNLTHIMTILENKVESTRTDNLLYFLSYDTVDARARARSKALGITTYTWQELIQTKKVESLILPKPHDVASLCYTSGTTGVAKGVIITHEAFAANIAAAIRGPLHDQRLDISSEDVYMSYLPLAHVLERILCAIVTMSGARLAIYAGDTRTLLDDIKAAQPTIFASVPRLYMRINDRINSGLAQNGAVVRYIFQRGMEAKLARLRESGTTTHPIWDPLVFKRIRSLMGNRLRYMLSGGAALEKNIQEKMACLFSCPLLEGYGLTETLGATFIRRADDCIYGHIGMPLASAEIKLRSVQDMNYCVTQDPPAGELLIRGFTVFPGYFMNPEATREAIDDDKWFATGDIAVRLNAGGRIKIIDRRKNMFKMSQGEYVTPEKIENIYCQAPSVSQICCYGDSNRNSLVALIVVDEDEVRAWARKDDVSELMAKPSDELKEHIRNQMESVENQFNLLGFEKVKRFHICSEPFTSENGFLTPTFKLKRNLIRDHYRAEIEMMYATLGQYHVMP